MFKITRDVGGVPGLLLAENIFTEEAEQHYFSLLGDSEKALEQPGQKIVEGNFFPPFPAEFHHALNAVRDCGLLPELIDPDYCMVLSYRPPSKFFFHYDSRACAAPRTFCAAPPCRALPALL